VVLESFLRLIIRTITIAVTAITATPPTTPPAMAPVLLELLDPVRGTEVDATDSPVITVLVKEIEEPEEVGVEGVKDEADEADEADDEELKDGEVIPDGNCVPVEIPFFPVYVGMGMGVVWPEYVQSTTTFWLGSV
jgi:hypothetical protein